MRSEYEAALTLKIGSLLDYFIPLPCFDYRLATGTCDGFECLSLDGEDPLCRTRRLLGQQLVAAIGINKYDRLHPEYNGLPVAVKNLIEEAESLKNGEPFPPPWMKPSEKPSGDTP